VVYLLHGEPGGASDLCNPSAGDSLAAAFSSGVQPFVVACPDGNDDDFDDTEWADSVDGRSQVETFVTGPLIAAVEGAHPRPRGLRAIGGFSMGGFGAAMLALRHPNLYGQVVTLAGYFTIDDPDGIFGDDPAVESAYNPTDLVALAPRMRWLLIEAAQHYRLSPKISKELSLRQQGLSADLKACSWKAQTRLHLRMKQLLARGKLRNKVTVAVARELCGFLWQIFQLMAPRMTQEPGAALSTKGSRFGGTKKPTTAPALH